MNDIWRLRAAAVAYLRYERQCPVVTMERGLGSGVPDACGVLPTRYMIEIEIKQTIADFRANHKKRHIIQRQRDEFPIYWQPRQFYFLVANDILDQVRSELPEYAGLMSLPMPGEYENAYCGIPRPIVRVPAPSHKHAVKLPIKFVFSMVKHQTGTLSSLLGALSNFVDRYNEIKQSLAKPNGATQ